MAAAVAAAAWGGEVTWQERALRAPAPGGYMAVVRLACPEGAAPAATLVCEAEGVELRAERQRWQVMAKDAGAAEGELPADWGGRLVVKRTASRLLLGVGGRWVYGAEAGRAAGKPVVRVGTSAGCEVERFRLVAREPVRFADDFPDPVPRTGMWAPVRGPWMLSSLVYSSQSANPAELAAVFDELEDEASRGRTRTLSVGIGVQLDRRGARVVGVAPGSPAERAGIRPGDWVREVDGTAVSSAYEATARLEGDEGKAVKLAVERNGSRRALELTRELVAWGTARRQVPIPPCKPDKVALITTGFDFWTDYRFECAVQTRDIGAFGLVVAYLGPDDYHLFRWLGADKVSKGLGCWQMVRVRGGRETVLAEREGGFVPHDFYAMSVEVEGDELGGVRARGAVDGATVVEAADDALVPGRLGFWAAAPGSVSFDDVAVGGDEVRRARGSANRLQRTDPLMRAWADPAYSWEHVGLGQRWEHKSEFPGDVALTAPFVRGQATELVVAADRGDSSSGYRLKLAGDGSAAMLWRAARLVGQKPALATSPKKATLERRGARVRVLLDGQPAIEWHDAEPLTGTAMRISGALPKDVVAECGNAVEYYFNGAPTEWHVMGGHWEVMNRWVCNPTWSFFGGRSDDLLAIWSKRRLDGDCFLEAHVGVMMLRMARYHNMRDVGLTICGDGVNLASGYTVIVGAEQNQKTALFRNGTLVATTRDSGALLPKGYMHGRGRGDQLHSQHRGWVHLRLGRHGRRVRLYVWDTLAIDYEDPEPLPGGHAGIWSVENGLLLAKVRLAAGRLGEPQPFLRRAGAFADGALTNDCLAGRVRIAAADGTYAITNAIGGGTFGVALRPRVFSAVQRPRLSFDIKLTPDAKVDLYLRCRGKLYRVALCGPSEALGGAEALGAFEGVQADGTWHRVSFDLLAALRRRHPDDPHLMVWEPVVANYSNHGYLLAGVGGNRAGATYWLRGLSLGRNGTDLP